jgi:hypothetical protein
LVFNDSASLGSKDKALSKYVIASLYFPKLRRAMPLPFKGLVLLGSIDIALL